ncbi:MAG: gamma-glutamylcyclotransferase family protein [Ilumatobacteraceae bacterium]
MTGTAVRHLFVYGTLRPGEVRWHHLEPFVVGDGIDSTVRGDLYDTGLDYPAAVFADPAASHDGGASEAVGSIRGRVYELSADRLDAALAHLDDVEGAVRGLYHRVTVPTSAGVMAWAYQCGDDALLRHRIASGDWQDRQR